MVKQWVSFYCCRDGLFTRPFPRAIDLPQPQPHLSSTAHPPRNGPPVSEIEASSIVELGWNEHAIIVFNRHRVQITLRDIEQWSPSLR